MVAVPSCCSGALPRIVAPSRNVTVPVAVGGVGWRYHSCSRGRTLTVTVVVWPTVSVGYFETTSRTAWPEVFANVETRFALEGLTATSGLPAPETSAPARVDRHE